MRLIYKSNLVLLFLALLVSFLVPANLSWAQDNSIVIEFKQLPPQLLLQLKSKPRVAPALLKLYSLRNNRVFFKALPSQEEVQLMPLAQMEGAPQERELKRSLEIEKPVREHEQYFILKPIKPTIVFKFPKVVDHRPQQSTVKNQGNRGTCVAHASMAALEIAYNKALNFSENYAYYKFLGSSPATVCNDPGLKTIDAADLMTTHGMCEEKYWAYVTSLAGLGCPNPQGWPITTCANNAKYQVTGHQKLYRNDAADDKGAYINNPKYLEVLLFVGRNIVFGTHVAGWPSGGQGVIDVKTAANGQPLPSVGGHAMLIVGYNRNGDSTIGGGYFIVKNSWGTGYGASGYIYLSYDYIRTYAKYGFYITSVK